MHLAYLTIDEVNQALACDFSSELDVNLTILAPKDGPPDRAYDAVLCDWDSMPTEVRTVFFAMSACDSLPRAVAVHGYSLTTEESLELLNLGVLIYRRLTPQVIRVLNRIVDASVRQAEGHHRIRKGPDFGLASAAS